MSRKNLLVVGVCCVGLSACNTMNSSRDYSYETSGGYVEAYQGGNLQTMPGYAYAYSGSDYVNYREEQDQMGDRVVTVPETYHVGAYHSPVPAKDRERNWVSQQNPEAYTIELDDSDKAAQVANKLYQAPKKERMAEVPYTRNGNQYYKGLYGSYSSREEAQKALDALPENLKQQAGVKNWRNVQETVGE